MRIRLGIGQRWAAPLLTVYLLFAPGGAAAASDPPVTGPLASFEQVMRDWIDRRGAGRASLAAMKDDRLVLAVGYNGRTAAERVPIWSLSKAITALCIAALAGGDGFISTIRSRTYCRAASRISPIRAPAAQRSHSF